MEILSAFGVLFLIYISIILVIVLKGSFSDYLENRKRLKREIMNHVNEIWNSSNKIKGLEEKLEELDTRVRDYEGSNQNQIWVVNEFTDKVTKLEKKINEIQSDIEFLKESDSEVIVRMVPRTRPMINKSITVPPINKRVSNGKKK